MQSKVCLFYNLRHTIFRVTPAPSANSTTVLPPVAAVDPKDVPYNATAPDAKESNDAPKRLFQGPPKPRGTFFYQSLPCFIICQH